jgi:DNA-directed RNA polymerase subunit H (RpoH/RPB5)
MSLYTVYTNVNKMMSNRGYKVVTLSQEEFKKRTKGDKSLFTFLYKTLRLRTIVVSYLLPSIDQPEHADPSLSKLNEDYEKITNMYREDRLDRIIFITNKQLKSNAKIVMTETKLKITFFNETNFFFNLVDHTYYSPHVRLTSTDIDNLLLDLRLSSKEKLNLAKKFPLLLNSDAVARYFDFQPGDVIKIVRNGELPSFRIVVDNSILIQHIKDKEYEEREKEIAALEQSSTMTE